MINFWGNILTAERKVIQKAIHDAINLKKPYC